MEDIEDRYTYYVDILGLSEEVFWNADVSFVIDVIENKEAYDGWLNYEMDKLSQKGG